MRLLILFLIALLFVSCKKDFYETDIDFSAYQIEDGFHLEAIAAEPLIKAPIVASFDDSGRIWVLEMTGYMRTLEGVNEEAPVGRIVILEDRDTDGKMDHEQVFLSNLKLARAMVHVYGGLLYAEPPYLYFAEIKSDLTPGKIVIVDSLYATGGNVEHQPNGLLLNIDNWIYNAKASKRYRLKNGEWQIENTSFRGQWGITNDAMGRLLYNDNSNQIRGDWASPNILNQNPNFQPTLGIGNNLVEDQRVFPLTATAVNRGYLDNMLHDDGKLKRFTSACGPLYFDGINLPEEYQGNVFVCAPEANLVKRNIIDFDKLRISGEQAWENKEFLSSTDEAFRPVNLYNGPDGSLYLIDMHRGIIQHKTYMTSYLRDKYIQKGLDTVKGMGRILKISSNKNTFKPVSISKLPPAQLVDSLSSRNIWIRKRAQHILVSKQSTSIAKKLLGILKNDTSEKTKIHALHTLEGLGELSFIDLPLQNPHQYPQLTAHALKLSASFPDKLSNEQLERLLVTKNEIIDYHLAFLISKKLDPNNVSYLVELLKRYDQADWFLEPVFSGIYGNEKLFNKEAVTLAKTLTRLDSISKISKTQETLAINESDGLTKGRILYVKNCATCHGPDGRGNKGLAPPLLNSEYIAAEPSKLIAILLYGLKGPISVNGEKFNLTAAMPGIGVNKEISNEDIKNIGNYVRNSFTTSAQNITLKLIDSLRNLPRPIDKMYTENELKTIYP